MDFKYSENFNSNLLVEVCPGSNEQCETNTVKALYFEDM